MKIKDAASEFLANKRVAVTGVSRHPKSHGSNVVYQRLRERGYEVFAAADRGHKAMRFLFTLKGNVPREV